MLGSRVWSSSLSSRWRSTLTAACAAVLFLGCDNGPAGTTITNVSIIDGTGAPAVHGAVRFIGDSIVAMGDVKPARGDSVVDGHGMVLAPGFIDTHSHHTGDLLEMPEALAAVSQGITTIVGGQDGDHPFPLDARLDTLAKVAPSLNVAYYAGHGTLREQVLGNDFKRKATAAEVDSMAKLLQKELDAGALGLSSGLEYDPGIYSDRSELLALAKVAAAAHGRYISHIRSEDRWFWDAVDEIITIGREAKLPVQISHIKLAMVPLWGHTDSLFTLLDGARKAGVDITADIYPYPYWQSTLTVLFPARDFRDRREAQKVLREISRPDGLLIGDFEANKSYVGKTVAEIAVMRHEDPASTLMGLIAESLAWEKKNPGRSGESVVATSMEEPDIVKLMQWEQTNICSDGSLDGAHPRGYGTFPRVLGRYVREQHALTLEQAVHKMTALSAAHVGLSRRGTIAPGMFADLVLFDPATIIDNATPQKPHEVSSGVVHVWVNGQTTWADGKTVRSRSGRVLRRQAQ